MTRILLADIKLAVCVGFGVSPDSMTSATRRAIFARPRQVAMYLARKHTRLSFPQIGEKFGGRDHTTVIHACRRIEALRASDPGFEAAIRACEAELAG